MLLYQNFSYISHTTEPDTLVRLFRSTSETLSLNKRNSFASQKQAISLIREKPL